MVSVHTLAFEINGKIGRATLQSHCIIAVSCIGKALQRFCVAWLLCKSDYFSFASLIISIKSPENFCSGLLCKCNNKCGRKWPFAVQNHWLELHACAYLIFHFGAWKMKNDSNGWNEKWFFVREKKYRKIVVTFVDGSLKSDGERKCQCQVIWDTVCVNVSDFLRSVMHKKRMRLIFGAFLRSQNILRTTEKYRWWKWFRHTFGLHCVPCTV